MGKRKTRKIKPASSAFALEKRGKLDKEFLCYFCQHEKAVTIKIDMQSGIGLLGCRICGVKFSTKVTALDEPIDVYTEWMDRCRRSNVDKADDTTLKDATSNTGRNAPLPARNNESQILERRQTSDQSSRINETSTKSIILNKEDADYKVPMLNDRSRKTIRDSDESPSHQPEFIAVPSRSNRIICGNETIAAVEGDSAEIPRDAGIDNLFEED